MGSWLKKGNTGWAVWQANSTSTMSTPTCLLSTTSMMWGTSSLFSNLYFSLVHSFSEHLWSLLLQMGVKLNSGQLEITEVELVLHRRGKQPVKWPLRCHIINQLFMSFLKKSSFLTFFVSGTWEDMDLRKDFLVLKQVREYLLDFELEKNMNCFEGCLYFFVIIWKESLLFQAVRIQQVPASTLSNAGELRISLICFRFPFLIFKSISIRFCPSPLLPKSVMSYALKMLYLNYNVHISYNAYDYYFRPVSGVKSQVQSLLMW